jgi:hypothetical protein
MGSKSAELRAGLVAVERLDGDTDVFLVLQQPLRGRVLPGKA